MKTVGDLIQEVFPLGSPQFEADAATGGRTVMKVTPLTREEFQTALYSDDPNDLDTYMQAQTAKAIAAYDERWSRIGLTVKLDGFEIVQEPDLFAWALPPTDPVDVFAISSLILELSGAYHHVQGEVLNLGASPKADTRTLLINNPKRQLWKDEGAKWRSPDGLEAAAPAHAPPVVENEWVNLLEGWDQPVFEPAGKSTKVPPWWHSALALMIMADEAAEGLGQSGLSKIAESWRQRIADRRIRAAIAESLTAGGSLSDQDDQRLYTLSSANPDVVCVLPKSRTTQVGCTLRCLSRNLALLPPRGLTRANWVYGQPPRGNDEKGKPLNLLLIPYPYNVEAKAFVQEATSLESDHTQPAKKPFGFFSVKPALAIDARTVRSGKGTKADDVGKPTPRSLEEFDAFLVGLINAMLADYGEVDVLVFPELALSDRLHSRLIELVASRFPGVEVIVAGLNSHRDKGQTEAKSGNFAAITIFSTGDNGKRDWFTNIHEKHHRWCLTRDQITTYGLGSALDPSKLWWEHHEIDSRRLTIMAFRQRATAAVLICEDLARTEPAQEVLRAIGPKLIFALLMDGPQLKTRWPARYATVLADDPGSSVLTLTSLALINRTNANGAHPPSTCIGLWRDAEGVTEELKLGAGCQALAISLSQISVCEQTMDGREDPDAATWVLSGITPLIAKNEKGELIGSPDWIA